MTDSTRANRPDIASPVRTPAIMNTYGIAVQMSLAQNFLYDHTIFHYIVIAVEITDTDDVVEVDGGI